MIRNVLVLSPESPYPLQGGGQYRTASLIHYFSRIAAVDLILFSESGKPALLPHGMVRSQTVISLPRNGKSLAARYLRNARRAVLGVPPLIDRLSGHAAEITAAIGDRRYDVGVIEHFWLAPYLDEVAAACAETVLDLHNVESMLHRRCAAAGAGMVAAGHRRFARATGKLEAALLPRFSMVLPTSDTDMAAARAIAPKGRYAVYPNALPGIAAPPSQNAETDAGVVVFSGNFEYHPNIDAVRFLVNDIWPLVRKLQPGLRLRLVGRGDGCIRKLLPAGAGIEVTGPVEDALREIAAARLVIAPLRIGSGTRIKILEAWAAARPVIATPLAAEGLAIRDGENIVLAETPLAFAETILRLLSDAAGRTRLAAAGRRTFEERYTWEMAWKALDRNLQLMRPPQLSRYTG